MKTETEIMDDYDAEFDDCEVEQVDPLAEINRLKADLARATETVNNLRNDVHNYKVMAEAEKKTARKLSKELTDIFKTTEPTMKELSGKVEALGSQVVETLARIKGVCAKSESKNDTTLQRMHIKCPMCGSYMRGKEK